MDTRIIEIEKYWADVVRNTAEFQQIANAQNPELNTLVGCIQRILQDAFINDATAYGVERWEKMLKIAPALTDTLETRKVRVLTYLSFKTPYTWRTLEQMIISYVGDGNYTMNYVNDTSVLTIRVRTNDINQIELIGTMLNEVLPQNIIVDLDNLE